MSPLAASLVHVAAVLAPAPQRSQAPALVEQVRTAGELSRRGDCRTALDIAAQVTGSKGFEAIPEVSRAMMLEIASACATSLGDLDLAYRTALAATVFPESGDGAWRLRLGLEIQTQRSEAAVASVEAMAATRSATLNSVDPRWLAQLDRALEQANAAALRRRLLLILSADTYRPQQPGVSTDVFRQRYATVLHDAGEHAAALAQVRLIDEPSLVVDLSLDPRFRAAFPADPDVRAVAERALVAARGLAARQPDAIGPVLRMSAMLRALGRPKEALAALEAIRPKVESTAKLADRDRQTVWWWNEIAQSEAMLGDTEGAVAALRRGAMMAEDGGANVSQLINLAGQLLAIGRPRDALAALGSLAPGSPNLSPFGTMQAMTVRGCAQASIGKPGDAAEAVAYARAHAAIDPSALTTLLLCAGDETGAAASMIARLDAVEGRVEALRSLSTFDPQLPGSQIDPYAERLIALGNRPDVRAAVARAGGTRRFNIQDVAY